MRIVVLIAACLFWGVPGSLAVEPSPDFEAPGRFQQAIQVLMRTATGRLLIRRAQDKWAIEEPEEIVSLLRWGRASRTDAVLSRHFDPKTGEEQRERTVDISIRRGQSLEDLVLDIAHELTHATSDPAWDPYDPKLTVERYIWAAIEAPGGEVDAMVSECRVGLELSLRFGLSAKRCHRYRDAAGADVDRDRIQRDFYRVGRWRTEVLKTLGAGASKFPLLSPLKPRLFSSTGQAPYPAALIREFADLTDAACRNSKRRLETFSSRAPASATPQRDETAVFVRSRCQAAR